MDLKLKDKIVLVTGSTRGIGKAIAQAFAKEGAKVIITGTIKDRAVKVAEELKNTYGVETLGLEMNIADSESVKKAFSEIEKKFKGVDILVNNAGITRDTLFIRMKEEDWIKVIEVNLNGVFRVTKHAVKYMLKKDGEESLT